MLKKTHICFHILHNPPCLKNSEVSQNLVTATCTHREKQYYPEIKSFTMKPYVWSCIIPKPFLCQRNACSTENYIYLEPQHAGK